jgi:Zn ribbon nucleic-acid-binding protein
LVAAREHDAMIALDEETSDTAVAGVKCHNCGHRMGHVFDRPNNAWFPRVWVPGWYGPWERGDDGGWEWRKTLYAMELPTGARCPSCQALNRLEGPEIEAAFRAFVKIDGQK